MKVVYEAGAEFCELRVVGGSLVSIVLVREISRVPRNRRVILRMSAPKPAGVAANCAVNLASLCRRSLSSAQSPRDPRAMRCS